MDKVNDIRKRYSNELGKIEYILQCLDNGRYYESSRAQCDGYLATNITNIRKYLDDLLDKIEYGQASTGEELAQVYAKYNP